MAFLLFLILTLAIVATILLSPTSAQITMPCTSSMITSFTPCMNFVTNSSLNGTTPSSDCCNSLKSLMGNGKDCLCQIATGSAPFQIPINQSLAISLPRACNMPGVPLQCKAAVGTPVPAPGPETFGPSASPSQSIVPTETTKSPSLAPEADVTPSIPTNSGGDTTSSTGSGTGVTPPVSGAHLLYGVSPLLIVALFGAIALKN